MSLLFPVTYCWGVKTHHHYPLSIRLSEDARELGATSLPTHHVTQRRGAGKKVIKAKAGSRCLLGWGSVVSGYFSCRLILKLLTGISYNNFQGVEETV